MGIAIVGDRFFALERVLATTFALLFFFAAVDEVDFALEAGLFLFDLSAHLHGHGHFRF